ncbi:MAG: glycosyltransferase [Alistipes shahii]
MSAELDFDKIREFRLQPLTGLTSRTSIASSVLARYAPEHEYIIGAEVNDGVDLYHGFRSSLPLSVHLRRVPSVMTVPNLNFLRYPHLYTFAERLFVLTLYRRALRRAGRVITVSAPAREELSERLNIDPSKIEVMVPLAVPAPRGNPSQAELEHVRRKYALPEHFILMIGTVEPRHNHQAVFAALADAASPAGVVVCGRRTAWSDYLLGYARARRIAARVDFIYELTPSDLPALFRLARVFAYLPDADAEASVVPVVEALRAGLPMVLSDTQVNREAAGEAAAYVRPEARGEVLAALENALEDVSWRRTMQERERRRAELFSEYAVAERLMQIYTSL